jgi:type VI secretion system secreted protein VgrG
MSELTLTVGGADNAAFRVHRFTLRERLHEPFLLSIVAGSTRPDLDLDAMILQPASFSLDAGWAFVRNGGARSFTGVCTAAEQLSAEPLGLSLYMLRLVPRLGLLALRRGYRIFQHATIPAILAELMREFDVPAALHLDEGVFPTLDYKVQYGETDLIFFTRLCEEAGITFALHEDERGGSVVVLSEAPQDAPLREGSPILFASDPSGTGEKEHMTGVRLLREAYPLAMTLRDFDFRNPALALAERAGSEVGLFEHAHFEPGAFRLVSSAPSLTPVADRRGTTRHEPAVGAERAAHRMAGERAAAHAVTFTTNALDLMPGSVFSMQGHPHPRLNEAARLLVTELVIDGERDKEWSASGKAVLADKPYAPLRRTPRPVVQGLQSAIVTGPVGEELFTDEHGRVRVRFFWDRGATSEEESSCWIRVSQGWAGAGFGLWTLPRVGQEVLISFLEGNPDEPIVVGRAPNAHNPPPYPLPAGATKAVWRSRSTPGDEGFNELSFEDRAGAERFYERAQRDKETLVLRDESLSVGGKRSHGVGGNEDRSIGGTVRERVGGDLHKTIKGERRDHVNAAHSVTVGGDRQEQLGGRWAVQADGAIHLFSGKAIVIEAPEITLKGAGGFLRVGAGGVTTAGGYAEIHPGAPGAGAGSDPEAPELPGRGGGELVPLRPRVRLPLLGFPGQGLPLSKFPPGTDPEKPVICEALCFCKSERDLPNGGTGPIVRGKTGRNRQQCVADRLWDYDRALGNQSTIKAEVPYDMSHDPPTPIMSNNDPNRPTHSRPSGSKIPDVVLVKDETRPPTQDNIRKIIEMKFDGDPVNFDQIRDFKNIGGRGVPVEIWTPESCGCGEEESKRVPVPVADPDPARKPRDEVLFLVLAILVLLGDDLLAPGVGEADDVEILPLLARLRQILAN